ncbi:MAG: hypothetical protein GX131_08650 [candidate division WS1 bacterium]|jgi:hypothetical protein|nr:hypothetical protein [candidate division WS1 bacterium]
MDDATAVAAVAEMLGRAWPFLRCTAAGVLGALANVALEDETVVLPRLYGTRLYLGFVGNLIVSVTMAHVVDHDFPTAFFAAVCGTTTLRTFKMRIESAFEHERKGVGGDDAD